MNKWFSAFAQWSAVQCGRSHTFVFACLLVLAWIAVGPYFKFSDTYNFVGNDFMSVCSLLILFLLQNSQNRDSKAMQIKLDELIRVTKDAQNTLIDVENTSEAELAEVKQTLMQARNDLSH